MKKGQLERDYAQVRLAALNIQKVRLSKYMLC